MFHDLRVSRLASLVLSEGMNVNGRENNQKDGQK